MQFTGNHVLVQQFLETVIGTYSKQAMETASKYN